MNSDLNHVPYSRGPWYNEKNQLHNLDGPTLVYSDGVKLWYINGIRYQTEEEYKIERERHLLLLRESKKTGLDLTF